MDILEIVRTLMGESATAALALFAIWMVRQLYELRLQEREDHAEQRVQERETYATRLETVNELLIAALEESNRVQAASIEVVRQNTGVIEELRRLLVKQS